MKRSTDFVPLDWRRLCTLPHAPHGRCQRGVGWGVEHMTRGPWVLSKASKPFGATWSCMTPVSVGGSSTHVLTRFMAQMAWAKPQRTSWTCTTSAEDQDAFACRSQLKAAAAQKEGTWPKRLRVWTFHVESRIRFVLTKTNSSNPKRHSRCWPSCVQRSERREGASRLGMPAA